MGYSGSPLKAITLTMHEILCSAQSVIVRSEVTPESLKAQTSPNPIPTIGTVLGRSLHQWETRSTCHSPISRSRSPSGTTVATTTWRSWRVRFMNETRERLWGGSVVPKSQPSLPRPKKMSLFSLHPTRPMLSMVSGWNGFSMVRVRSIFKMAAEGEQC